MVSYPRSGKKRQTRKRSPKTKKVDLKAKMARVNPKDKKEALISQAARGPERVARDVDYLLSYSLSSHEEIFN